MIDWEQYGPIYSVAPGIKKIKDLPIIEYDEHEERYLSLKQKCKENIFLTLNPYFEIDTSKILKKIKFTHPYFDQSALTYQTKLKNLQNNRNILFCGSYFD